MPNVSEYGEACVQSCVAISASVYAYPNCISANNDPASTTKISYSSSTSKVTGTKMKS
jgi:hypothetical protein